MDRRRVLVLEGGGMRGLYGAGVLDFFAEKNLYFDDVVGVSMGACNGANYLSNQSERNFRIPHDFIDDRRYLSYKRWLLGGELFDMEFIFEKISNELDPFDYDALQKSSAKLHIVCTDCESGESRYFSDFDSKEEFGLLLKASSSLPFAAKSVNFGGEFLLDGGISDPIPLGYAQNLDAQKIVLVLTQPQDYRKKAMKLGFLLKLFYPKFKGLQTALLSRHKRYNETLETVNSLENGGKIFVIRPQSALLAARIEKDKTKLKATLDCGYLDAKRRYSELLSFLG